MKDELKCRGCMYIRVPDAFQPCIGCKHNITVQTQSHDVPYITDSQPQIERSYNATQEQAEAN